VPRPRCRRVQILVCVSGTIFGRDVVPDVNKNSAMAPGRPDPRWRAGRRARKRKQPGASPVGVRSAPASRALAPRGAPVNRLRRHINARGLSRQSTVQLLGRIGRVDRGACRVRCRGDNRNREVRPIRQGTAIRSSRPMPLARKYGRCRRYAIKAPVAQRRTIRSQYRGRLRKAPSMTLQQVIKRRNRDADFLL